MRKLLKAVNLAMQVFIGAVIGIVIFIIVDYNLPLYLLVQHRSKDVNELIEKSISARDLTLTSQEIFKGEQWDTLCKIVDYASTKDSLTECFKQQGLENPYSDSKPEEMSAAYNISPYAFSSWEGGRGIMLVNYKLKEAIIFQLDIPYTIKRHDRLVVGKSFAQIKSLRNINTINQYMIQFNAERSNKTLLK